MKSKNHIGLLNVINASIIGILIVYLPFFDTEDLFKGYIRGKIFLFCCIIAFLVFSQEISWLLNYSRSVRRNFHLIDFLILLFAIYISLNHWFVSHDGGFSLKYFQMGASVIFYFLLRSSPAKYYKFFIYSIIMSGFAQSIYGILQLYGFYPSKHHLFNITGSFFNPGPYAGYLSIVFPLALAVWLQERKQAPNTNAKNTLTERTILKLKSLLPLASVIAILLVLPATRSRAAWLAALISSAMVLNHFYPLRNILSPFRKPGLKKLLSVSIVLILFSGALTGIYFMKKGSADGRMFIWKVSKNLIKEKPVFGHGHEKFQAFYMDKQADYFIDNPGSVQANVADDIIYPFNEYIKILVELGIVGLSLLALIVFLLFRPGEKARSGRGNPDLLIPSAGILAFLVFSFFSYPSEILPIILNLVVLLAITVGTMQSHVHDKQIIVPPLPGWRSLVPKTIIGLGTLAIIVLASAPIRNLYKAYYKWDEGHKIYQMGAYEASLESFEEAYPYLKNNGEFLIMYGKALSMAEKYGKAIEVLQEAGNFQKNTILYNALGDSFKATGEFKNAESAYLNAYYMLPGQQLSYWD